MILGADLSSYFELKRLGGKWSLNGVPTDPYSAFASNGCKMVRIRIWNDPYDEEGKPYEAGTCDVKCLLESAKLAKVKGMSVLPDFHYSDFWADPGKQTLPKAWKNDTYEELQEHIYSFTKDTLLLLKKEDIDVSAVQVGNEITNGMCWPYGRLVGEPGEKTGYDKLVPLLKAGIKAVREVYPKAKVILHLENAGRLLVLTDWLDHVTATDIDFDIIGLSYYPYWHGSMPNFFYNVGVLQGKYHKDVWIVEVSYAFTDRDYLTGEEGQLVVESGNLDRLNEPLPFPLTKDGQFSFFEKFIREAKAANVGAIFYWEPAFIPVKGCGWASIRAQEYMGCTTIKDPRNEWANQNLFDYGGEATPAFHIYKD